MESIGKYYKLFTLKINGVRYYFIGDKNYNGFRWFYTEIETAFDMFESLENYAEKYGKI